MPDSMLKGAAKFRECGEAVKKGQRAAVNSAGAVARNIMQAGAEAARTKGVRTTITPFAHSATGEAVNVHYGPPGWVHIMNDATSAHFIAARRGGSLRKQGSSRGTRRGKQMALASAMGGTVGAGAVGAIHLGNGIGWKAYAFHKGTRGKHFAYRSIKSAEAPATKSYQSHARAEFGRFFHG